VVLAGVEVGVAVGWVPGVNAFALLWWGWGGEGAGREDLEPERRQLMGWGST